MKYATLLLLCALSAPVLAADGSACYSIADADRRAVCLAKAHNDPSRCYSVKDAALRSECLSEVKK